MPAVLKEEKFKRYTQAQIFMKRLDDTRNRVKIGDKLTVWTIKGAAASVVQKSEVHRKARVIGLYPHFVHVRLRSPYGKPECEESFTWDDVMKWNKFLWEGAEK